MAEIPINGFPTSPFFTINVIEIATTKINARIKIRKDVDLS